MVTVQSEYFTFVGYLITAESVKQQQYALFLAVVSCANPMWLGSELSDHTQGSWALEDKPHKRCSAGTAIPPQHLPTATRQLAACCLDLPQKYDSPPIVAPTPYWLSELITSLPLQPLSEVQRGAQLQRKLSLYKPVFHQGRKRVASEAIFTGGVSRSRLNPITGLVTNPTTSCMSTTRLPMMGDSSTWPARLNPTQPM